MGEAMRKDQMGLVFLLLGWLGAGAGTEEKSWLEKTFDGLRSALYFAAWPNAVSSLPTCGEGRRFGFVMTGSKLDIKEKR